MSTYDATSKEHAILLGIEHGEDGFVVFHEHSEAYEGWRCCTVYPYDSSEDHPLFAAFDKFGCHRMKLVFMGVKKDGDIVVCKYSEAEYFDNNQGAVLKAREEEKLLAKYG